MRFIVLVTLLMQFQTSFALTKEESLKEIEALKKMDVIQKAIKVNTIKQISQLNIEQVNSYLIATISLRQKLEKHRIDFGFDESFKQIMPQLLLTNRILDLKKNELLLGHLINWEMTTQWVENERKRMIVGGNFVPAYKWKNTINDPHNIFKNRNYMTNFYNLPLKGSLDKHPHSDDYWPSYRGGISYRWYKSDKKNIVNNFNYPLMTAEEVEKMSLEDLKKLSPSEKYDIYTGSYKNKKRPFALTRSERKRTKALNTVPNTRYYDSNFKIPTWMGLCHAWAPSTLMYTAPKPVVLKGKTGIMVPFGSSDIKALLTLNVHHNIVPYLPPMVGNACKEDFKNSNKETIRMLNPNISSSELERKVEELFKEVCGPVDPGAFHIVLTTKLGGKSKEGVIVDVDPGLQVWNQPVFKYEAKILSARNLKKIDDIHKIKGVRKLVRIQNTIYYIKELHPRWEGGYSFDSDGKNRAIKPMILEYELELDNKDRIVGGKWISEEKIDYISTKYYELFKQSVRKKNVETLKYLPEIYKASVK